MRQVMVRYKVKPDRVAENEALVRAVYEELAAPDPAGLLYATIRMEDGVTFGNLARVEGDRNPLTEVAAFERFQEGIRDRCDEPPLALEAQTIGSYRL